MSNLEPVSCGVITFMNWFFALPEPCEARPTSLRRRGPLLLGRPEIAVQFEQIVDPKGTKRLFFSTDANESAGDPVPIWIGHPRHFH